MRLRRGGMDRLIRRFVAGTVLVLLLLLCGRYMGRRAGAITRNDFRQILESGGRWLVETIWNQAVPQRQEADGGSYGIGREDEIPDPDPSYRKYQTVKTFYQEHEYLAWYGNEESGQQAADEQLASVSGGAYDRGGGTQALTGPDGAPLISGSRQDAVLVGSMNRPVTGSAYVMEQLIDYDFLMKHFYSVHTSTTAGRDLMNAKTLLEKDLTLEKDSSGPQILIYHTHSQEAFKDSGPGQTVVGLGDYLTELLEAKGYNVYHDKSVYDLKNGQLDRSKAYNYALDGITNILQQNPTIQVVLDIHRDGVGENLHLVTQVDGKDTAQIMFFNGLSQTPEGPIEYLQNPNREDNLAFSLQMQLNAAAYYPGFTRKIYLKGLRYNQHLRPRSSLIEAGAQTNTYQEALNAMEPLSELLDMVLRGDEQAGE
ncbi:MAG: stage II sporulation protein P [Clostridium sp.]|nr:stage II sporulation protein P [Clostridium sp.]